MANLKIKLVKSLNGRLEHCKQCTAHARKEGGDDKRQHLVLKQVNAHCFCRNFVIADGLERAAVGGVDQQNDQGNANDRHKEGNECTQPQNHLPRAVFDIEIREELSRTVTVKAETLGDAINQVMDQYKRGEIVLDAEDFVGKTIDAAPTQQNTR